MAGDALTPGTLLHCGVRSDLAQLHAPLMMPAMREHAITTRARARMFIAQVLEESIALTAFHELASGAEYQGRLGNIHPGDGVRYKGRGPIQLTGRSNYAKFGKLLGLDLEGNPELAAQPKIAWRVSAAYFQNAGCNNAADAGDFRRCTFLINGGFNGLDTRLHYYGLLEGQGVIPGKAFLSTGDSGHAVLVMTRRLSHLRSATTGKVYLDGKRQRFDAESEQALRQFQSDHKLRVDGHFGPASEKALAGAIERAKARHGHPVKPPPLPRPKPPAPHRPPVTGVELLARMNALDGESARLLRALERRRVKLEARPAPAPAREGIEARIERLELTVGQLRSELTTVESGGAVAPAAAVVTAVITQAAPVVAPAEPATANGRDLGALTTRELELQLARMIREGERVRALLLDRFTQLEKDAGTLVRPAPPPKPRPKPVPGRPKPADPEDGDDGSAGAQHPGGKSWPIRQSKLALQRYLKAKDPAGSLKLRRRLQRDRLSPKTGRSATPVWTEAITAAQKLAGLPQGGQLDGALARVLRPYWPPESPARRVVKGTPAWRLIPGQLTKNFNVREFACSDGTGYVAGLVREQGLTKQQARARARELAKRLERLRRIEGNRPLRPTSVFRTKARNAATPGSAKNSAHLRGFAADVPPPPGITLVQHRENVRSVFEGGVGFYVQMHFVHGDFDTSLGRRAWNGP